jgi:2-polyprenyl-3-methyl-5-hydroxy-6-metoxy-1,4-benzoquinol methylase
MNNHDDYLIFPFTGQAHITLTSRQREVVEVLQDKIDRGIYVLEDGPCLCGAHKDSAIAETDRYGLKLKTVVCSVCGLLRTNPRLSQESLGEFYQQEYRDLYMGPEYKGLESYFQGMIRRGIYLIELIRRFYPDIKLAGKNVLEIGCSMGGILVPFLKSGAKVKGYDYDQRYLDYGKNRYPGLELLKGGIEKLEAENVQYDIIILNHVLEHLACPGVAVDLLKARIKPEGIIYVSVPGVSNPEYYFSSNKSFLGALHIAHLYHFSPKTLCREFRGFVPVHIDNQVNALFKLDDGKAGGSCDSHKDEARRLVKFIRVYEFSWHWRLLRALLRIKERYDKGLIWRIHKLKMFLTQDALRAL